MRLKCTICLCLYERDAEICALLCGHIYHVDCINHWLSTNSSCPSCRKKVQRNKIVEKLYLEHDDTPLGDSQHECSAAQTNRLSDVQAKLAEKELEIRTFNQKISTLESKIVEEERKTTKMETKYYEEHILTKSLKKQLENLKGQQDDVKRAKLEVDTMREYLTTLKNVELVVKGSEAEVANMINQNGEGSSSVKNLATCCVILKREFELLKQTKRKLKDDNEKQRREGLNRERELSKKTEQIKRLEKDIVVLKSRPSPITPQPVSRVRTTDNLASPLVRTPQPIDTDTPEKTTDIPVFDLDTENRDTIGNKNAKRKFVDSSSDSDSKTTFKIKIKGNDDATKRAKAKDPIETNPMLHFGIMKKKTLVNGSKLSVRTGYDGLGSHSKFISTSSHKPAQMKMSSFFNR